MIVDALRRWRGIVDRGEPGRLTIPHLEMHVTQRCNLTCEGCLHYMNHGHARTYSVEDLRRSMSLWNQRLLPRSFALLGGEPTLHKDLVEIVRLAREMWPSRKTRIELVTNGLLLHRHPGLPQALAETKTALVLSLHGDAKTAPKYHGKVSDALDLARRWQREFRFELDADPGDEWQRGYHGFGSRMAPFEDGDPQSSWDHCVTGQECFQLYDDCLWKCAPLAYLHLQDRKFGLSEKWAPYLAYEPLRPDCSDEALASFFQRKAEAACGMCPGKPQRFVKRDPLLPVKFYLSGGDDAR